MPDIRFNFVASGAGDVKGAFRDIDTAARESAKSFDKAGKSAGASAKAAGDGARAAKAPISETAKLAERVAKDQERAAARAGAAGEKAAKRSALAAEQAAAATTKAAQKAATAQEKAASKGASAAEKAAAKSAAAQAKSAEKAAAAEEKAAKKAADAHSRALDHVAQLRSRFETQQERLAARGAAAEQRASERATSRRNSAVGSIAKESAVGTIGAAAGALGLVGAAAQEGMRLQESSNRLSISARGAGEKGADATTLRREFEAAAADAPGIKAADIAEGVQGFVAKTGDLESGRKFASTFATAASATGSNVGDIANAAADISQKFDIKGVEEMKDALAALTFQGKKGAFELKDAASQFAKMSAAAERFGLSKGTTGLKTLGGLTQIARSATGSPEQAATAVEAMFRQLVGESGKLKAMGVDVFKAGTNNTQTNDVRDVITSAISKSGGSLPKLQKIFGEEGIRGISPLISTFNEAKGKATGTEAEKTAAGITALREALASAIDAPGDWAEVVKDAAAAQKDSSAVLDSAWERLKAQVSESVIPALSKIVPKLAGMEGAIEPAIVVFDALVEAGGLVVDLFKFLGLIHPKVLTPGEQLQKNKKDLDSFNERFNARNHLATPEETKEKLRLEAAVKTADDASWTKPVEVGKGKPRHQLDAEEFAKQYAGASSDTLDSKPEIAAKQKAAAEAEAKALAQKLITDPNAYEEHESPAQRKIREQYVGKGGDDGSAAPSAPTAAPAGDSGAIALNQAAKALTSAADALKAGQQGSITGGTSQ